MQVVGSHCIQNFVVVTKTCLFGQRANISLSSNRGHNFSRVCFHRLSLHLFHDNNVTWSVGRLLSVGLLGPAVILVMTLLRTILINGVIPQFLLAVALVVLILVTVGIITILFEDETMSSSSIISYPASIAGFLNRIASQSTVMSCYQRSFLTNISSHKKDGFCPRGSKDAYSLFQLRASVSHPVRTL